MREQSHRTPLVGSSTVVMLSATGVSARRGPGRGRGSATAEVARVQYLEGTCPSGGEPFSPRGLQDLAPKSKDLEWHEGRTPCPRLRAFSDRSEEHTSELQSQSNLVCRLLLEKKK